MGAVGRGSGGAGDVAAVVRAEHFFNFADFQVCVFHGLLVGLLLVGFC